MIKTLGIENEKTLYIFDAFQIDKNLKKWNQKKIPKGKIGIERDSAGGLYVPVDSIDEYENPETFAEARDSLNFLQRRQDDFGLFASAVNPRRNFTNRFKLMMDSFRAAPVEKIFERILLTMDEVNVYVDRTAEIDKMIANATELGQKTLVVELQKKKSEKLFDEVLFAKNRKKFITEEQLLEFGKKCERGLCLDWISDFVRVIPEAVLLEKRACDSDMLFDNYVILHFDPEQKATTAAARKKEEEKRKDPILFGVIKDSRKLYFVADWKDELCTLTLSDIVEKLGTDLEMK